MVERTQTVTSAWLLEKLQDLGLQISPQFQQALFLEGIEQIITGGVRSGKSTVGAAKVYLLPQVWTKQALIWIVGPTYQATESEMFYLWEWFGKMGVVARFQNTQNDVWKLELANGTVIETRSAQHTERLASVAPDFILVTEAGQCPPTVRTALLGRALEKNATICYTGTVETDDNKPRFAWFEQLAVRWAAGNEVNRHSIALPSWANISVFPGGEHDEKIEAQRPENGGYDAYTFARMVGGQPIGAAHPAYPALQEAGADSKYLQSLPDGTRWITAVGGGDWGVKHPWALVVVSVSTQQIATAEEVWGYKRNVCWVRECVWSGANSGDSGLFNQSKRGLASKYSAGRWGVDPVQSSLADNAGTAAVGGSAGSRDRRIGMVRSRLNNSTLFFDLVGAGVTDLYNEMKQVRYRLRPDGKFELVRIDDDRTAALEDAIEVLDSVAHYPVGVNYGLSGRVGASREWQSV